MDPSEAWKAADARVKAAQAEFDAALKAANDMAEFGGKGDAVADEIIARTGRRINAAHSELDKAESARADATLKMAAAARKAREASTPIDDMLMGAADPAPPGEAAPLPAGVPVGHGRITADTVVAPEPDPGPESVDEVIAEIVGADEGPEPVESISSTPTPPPGGAAPAPPTPAPSAPPAAETTPPRPKWSTPVDGLIAPGIVPETSHESPQPNEFEPRPLPPDLEEPEPATTDPAAAPPTATIDLPAGTSRRTIAAIAGLGIIGAGAIGAILLLNNGRPAPGQTAGPAETSAAVATAAPGSASVDATPAAGSAAPGSGTYAGRWTMVTGFDDPTGIDVTARWFAGDGPFIEPLPAAAYFEIDAANSITGGEYHVGILTDDECHPKITVDAVPATGSVDVNGVGVVYWNAGTITEEQCNSNTGDLTTTSGADVPHWFQFRIVGEEMVVCRSNVTASMTECADPYPRRVALFRRTP